MTSPGLAPPPDPVLVLRGKCAVTSLVCLNSDRLVAGYQNGEIEEWVISTQRATTSWTGHTDTVLWLGWEDDKLFSQGREGRVKVWSKNTNTSVHWSVIAEVISAPLIFCNCSIVNTPHSKLLAIPSEEMAAVNIHFIDSTFNKDSLTSLVQSPPVLTLQPIPQKSYGMCMKMCSTIKDIKTGSGHLLVGYESGAITLWDASKGEVLHSLDVHADSIMCLTCWCDPSTGAVTGLSATSESTIQSWKISNTNSIHKENSVSVVNSGFNVVAVRHDGRIFVSGGWDNYGRVFSRKKLRPLAVLGYHKDSINCAAFSPDNTLVLGSKDGYITFWDVYKNC